MKITDCYSRLSNDKRGQALVEYLLVAGVFIFFVMAGSTELFTLNGNEVSLFDLIIDAWQVYLDSFDVVIALPL